MQIIIVNHIYRWLDIGLWPNSQVVSPDRNDRKTIEKLWIFDACNFTNNGVTKKRISLNTTLHNSNMKQKRNFHPESFWNFGTIFFWQHLHDQGDPIIDMVSKLRKNIKIYDVQIGEMRVCRQRVSCIEPVSLCGKNWYILLDDLPSNQAFDEF